MKCENILYDSSRRLPLPVEAALLQIGSANCQDSTPQEASRFRPRLNVSLPTLRKLEAGNPGASLGTFVLALWMLDLLTLLTDALDPARDDLGLTLELARMPKRVREREEIDLDDLRRDIRVFRHPLRTPRARRALSPHPSRFRQELGRVSICRMAPPAERISSRSCQSTSLTLDVLDNKKRRLHSPLAGITLDRWGANSQTSQRR